MGRGFTAELLAVTTRSRAVVALLPELQPTNRLLSANTPTSMINVALLIDIVERYSSFIFHLRDRRLMTVTAQAKGGQAVPCDDARRATHRKEYWLSSHAENHRVSRDEATRP